MTIENHEPMHAYGTPYTTEEWLSEDEAAIVALLEMFGEGPIAELDILGRLKRLTRQARRAKRSSKP